MSRDEGKSWPVFRSIEPGYSAYSDLAVTHDGTILCFYGRSKDVHFAGDRLTLARIPFSWIAEAEKKNNNEASAGAVK